MTLSPPRCSRLPGPYGPVAPALVPSVVHESPAFDAQDRIYCVPWCRRDKFTNRLIVDKATWREAFDHEAFHSRLAQGSASGVHGPSPLGRSVPPGLFLPGGKGVDRPFRQGMDRSLKLAENVRSRVRKSVVLPAHNPGRPPAPVRPLAGAGGPAGGFGAPLRGPVRAGCRIPLSRPSPEQTARWVPDGPRGSADSPGRVGSAPPGRRPRAVRADPAGAVPPGAARGRGGGRCVCVEGNRHCHGGPVSGMLRKTPHAAVRGAGNGGVGPYPWG